MKRRRRKEGVKENFLMQIEMSGLLEPVAEYKFHPVRRWRIDYAVPDRRLAFECEGGVWIPGGGRHNRPAGFLKDIEKYNSLSLLGWRLFRFTPQMIRNGEALEIYELAINADFE